VNFKPSFNHKEQGGFLMVPKGGHLLVADIEYPFQYGALINYTLDGVTQLLERKETAQGFHHDASGDFKTVTEFIGCERI
jgi:hypothetical protein